MTSRIGIEIGPRVIRGVRVDGWLRSRIKLAELEWDPKSPAAAVEEVRAHLGKAQRVAVAVDPSFLYIKQVKLPPVPVEEKRRILSLEPERYFPIRGEDIVVAVREGDNLVFAAAEPSVREWVSALEPLGPVDLVEPAPAALARVLARSPSTRSAVLIDREDGALNVVAVGGGRVARVRQVAWDPREGGAAILEEDERTNVVHVSPWEQAGSAGGQHGLALPATLPGISLEPLPSIDGVPPAFQIAYGAALGVGHDLNGALVWPELARQITHRRWRDLSLAAAALAAAVVLVLASADAARDRALRTLSAETRALQQRAGGLLALRAEADALDRQARAVAQLEATRPDPLGALLTITRRLPSHAFVRSIRASGSEWQIEGQARDAAQLVPLFEAAPDLEQVRFLSATSRLSQGKQSYETFSIALRYVPAP